MEAHQVLQRDDDKAIINSKIRSGIGSLRVGIGAKAKLLAALNKHAIGRDIAERTCKPCQMDSSRHWCD